MKVKKYLNNSLDNQIKTAFLFIDNDKTIQVFSDYDEDLTCAILKCYIDGKYEKITEVE